MQNKCASVGAARCNREVRCAHVRSSRKERKSEILKRVYSHKTQAQPVDFYILGPGLGILVEDEVEGLMIKLLRGFVALRMGEE